MGDMLGLGVGMAAAKAIVPQIGEMLQGMNPTGSPDAEAAPAAAEPAKQAEAPVVDEMAEFEKKIKKLRLMKENGLLSEEAFEQAKNKLLSEIL